VAAELLSPAWYRVADLRPRLRSHFRIHRHEYRGERWYVLEDRISRRSHRFNPGAYLIVGLMDGRRTMQEIWDGALQRLGDEAPTQDEVMQVLGQLHVADAMQCDVSSDLDELLRRTQRLRRRGTMAKWLSPLAIKFPLLDPDRLLERWRNWYRPLFSPAGALVWLLVVGWAALAAIQHWTLLTQDLSNRVLAPHNLLLVALVFPVLKAAHEFGHACAVKAWGGEVHEMGIMLLVLMPVPYVDASSASAFPQRGRRIVVGAGGMIVEVFIASVALFFWLEMEPGILKAVLFNVMLIAGVSTLMFNANPLLRFDGYYMLADWLELPNLRQRSQQYLSSAFQRRAFGLPPPPVAPSGRERFWLATFAVASYIYRWLVTFGIALFVASQYFVFGVLLALWAAVAAILLPVGAGVAYLAWSPRLRRHRMRAVIISLVITTVLAVLVFVIPIPSWTAATGVVAVPENALVVGRVDGVVTRLLAESGAEVGKGDPLVELDDPALRSRVALLGAQRDEIASRYLKERKDNPARSQGLLPQLEAAEAELARARERQADLILRSPAAGRFSIVAPQYLPGRYLKQGEQLGIVLADEAPVVRVLLPQESADQVRLRSDKVTVRLASSMADPMSGKVLREVPKASDRVVNQALTHVGGGDLALDPLSTAAQKSLQTHFEVDIGVAGARSAAIGEHAYVRFEHPWEPLATQVWRALRQLFLKRFTV
jgi:putative peptide zinc metalloprotease protein